VQQRKPRVKVGSPSIKLYLDNITNSSTNPVTQYNNTQKRNNYLDKPNIDSFDSYVLRSPDDKWEKSTYSTKNKDYNTIDSKFRSVEKFNKKKLIQSDFTDKRNQLLKSIDSKAYSNIRIKNGRGTESNFKKFMNEDNFTTEESLAEKYQHEYCSQNIQSLRIEKRGKSKELEAKSKRMLKQHKDTFTFGLPTKYSKLQSNINVLIDEMSNPKTEKKSSYCNANQ